MTNMKKPQPLTWDAESQGVTSRMVDAASAFLASLNDEQRMQCLFPFKGDERYVWNYVPVDRNGLLLKDMTEKQRAKALEMMKTAYSVRSGSEALSIMELETLLAEYVTSTWVYSPLRYWFSVFGDPGGNSPWGFRVGGHHIGLIATITSGKSVTVNPLFLGANPAQIKHGKRAGERTLSAEEDMARTFLTSLNTDQRRLAIVDDSAPNDILTKNYRVADRNAGSVGILFPALSDFQRTSLLDLVQLYVSRSADELAANYWKRLESNGWDSLSFAWAGPQERGKGHYYAVHNDLFIIEYDNTQDGANHIHSVLRDFDDDWGEDLLAAHYADSHSKG